MSQPKEPEVVLVFDTNKTITEVPGEPGTFQVWTVWRGGQIMGYTKHGEKDQVMADFDMALRAQYVSELRYWAREVIVERQPEGGPRM